MTNPQSDLTAQITPTGLIASRGWREIGGALMDLVFPPQCSSCGRVDTRWCTHCQRRLEAFPVTSHHRTSALAGVPVASTGEHTGILQDAIHALKYDDVQTLRYTLAHRLRLALEQLGWTADLIAPVPMHPNRLRTRGYNQSALLGMALSEETGIPHEPGALVRLRDTRSQVGLDQHERLQNVRDAFATATDVQGKTVLLIDDVLTTGATLAGCAQVLKVCGAVHILALTVTAARP